MANVGIQQNISEQSATLNNVQVKQERSDDAEINAMAAKLIEQNKAFNAKNLQTQQQLQQQQQQQQQSAIRHNNLSTIPGQTNILGYLTRKGSQPANNMAANNNTELKNGDSDKKPCDDESQKGRFGWATFSKTHIPFIYRQTEKYCAVRMVELKLLNKYLNYLHQDIYSCTCVRSYYITDAESRLLNEINHKHCDSQFGRDMFTLKDLVVRLSDANKFYLFLDICYKKLLMGSSGPSDKCGFIRINKESVVPYTVRDNQKFVPLFYFEGETDNLKLKADYLSGWDLSYLKFCCKVQGIRNELFASESVAVISLTDIKSYFPSGTEFEDYWPNKVVDTQLLVGSKTSNISINWTRQPSAPPPKQMNNNVTKIGQQQHQQQQQQQQHQQQQQQQQQQVRKTNSGYGNSMSTNVPMVNQRLPTVGGMTNTPTAVQQAGINAAVQAITNGWATGQPAMPQGILTPAQTEQLLRMATQAQAQRGYPTTRSQMQNPVISRSYNAYQNNSVPINSLNNMMPSQQPQSQQQQQQPPPLVRSQSNVQNQSHISNTPNSVIQLQQHQQLYQQQQLQHNQHQQQQQLQQQQQQQRNMNSMVNNRNPLNNALNPVALHHQRTVQQQHQMQLQQQQQQQQHQQQQQLQQQQHQHQQQSQDLNCRLQAIPELSPPGSQYPYKMQSIRVENAIVPVINMKAYSHTDVLMTVGDLIESFFPTVSLETCKRFLCVLHVELYRGNRHQVQLLKEHTKVNMDSNMPLVRVSDINQYFPQLAYMVRGSQAQEQPPSKRNRVS